MSCETVVLLLAAGGGSRFRGATHKLDAPLGDRTVLAAAIDHAVEAAVGPVVVVTAAHVRTVPRHDVHVVVNEYWADGQMSSLRLGLDAADVLGAARAVIGLGDQPFIEPAAWRHVAAGGATSPIAVATYDGRRGHPVALAREVWADLPGGGDEGARTLMRARPDLVVEIPCPGSPQDIDTLEDLERWQNNSSTSSR